MKRYFKILFIICVFFAPFITNAQINKENFSGNEKKVIWRTGSFPFGKKRISEFQQKEKLDSLVNNADFIVEGSAYKEILTFADRNGKIWHISQLEIYKKIKGDIPEDKIYFLWQDHTLYFDSDDVNHDYYKNLHYTQIPSHTYFNDGIFFLSKSNKPVEQIKKDTTLSKNSIYSYYDKTFSATEKESMIYEPIDLYQWGISYNEVEYYYGPYQMKFDNNKWQLYDFFKEQYNLNIPNYTKNIEKKNKIDSLSTNIISNDTDIENIENNFRIWLTGGRAIPKNLLRQRLYDSVTCELSTIYQHLECNDTACYFVFDLNCCYKSNDIDTVYPDNILLYFEYNKKAFNANIVSQGKLNLICNYPFFDTTYYELTAIDHPQNDNQVAIRLTAKTFISEENGMLQAYTHRRPVPVNEDFTIAQIRIRVPFTSLQNSNNDYQKVELRELWNHLDFNFNFWADNVTNVSPIYLVDTISLSINESYVMGNVYINNVVPLNYDHFWGGGDCLMKILGKGFMERKKLSNFNVSPVVQMKSSDICDEEDPYPIIPIDWTDIKLWTDTCIILNIPSAVYGKIGARNKNIGSSEIYVKNQVNGEGHCYNQINIVYSILNYVSPIPVVDTATNLVAYQNKQIPYWARINCSDQIQFEVNEHLMSLSYIENIQKAFDEWNRILGFTFYTFKRDADGNIQTTSTNSSLADSISVIYWISENSNVNAGVNLQTIQNNDFLSSCNPILYDKYARREIDMFINIQKMSDIGNSTQQCTFIHELGHGIGLGHVLNKNDNMYPTIDEDIYTDIKDGARLGAMKLFEMSDTVLWACSNFENIHPSENTTCPPPQPSFIKAKGISKTSMQIQWTSDIKATSYTLRRSLNSNMSNAQILNIPFNTDHYTDTALSSNTQYYYQVRANNANGNSSYSYIGNGKTKRINLFNKLKGVSVENDGTNSIIVKWSEDTTNTIQNYIIERQEDDGLRALGDFHVIAVLDSASTEFHDYDIVEGVSYNYRLRYTTEEGVSLYTPITSVTPSEYNEHSIMLPVSRNALLYKNELPIYSEVENTNYNNFDVIRTWKWTHSGMPTYMRSLFDIDLSQIPSDAIIESAQLELKGVDHMTNLTEHSSSYKSNASWIELVTESWDETQVTWNTQPASSSTYRVSLPNSTTRTQNYSVDITELIAQMVADTSVHGFMLRLQNEDIYTRMSFASPTYSVDSLHPYVLIKYITTPLQTLAINPQKDAVIYKSYNPNHGGNEYTYYGDKETILAETWTYSGYIYYVRGLMDFDLSEIPSNAKVFDATLDLYSPYPQTEETYKHYSSLIMNNPTAYKSNESYLRCITDEWGENSTTWNSQPACDTLYQVLLPQSTAHRQDYLGIRIDRLIQRMVSHPDSTHGLMLELKNESKYTRMVFASSDFPDVSLHPKLTVNYKVYPSSRLKSYSSIAKGNDYKSFRYMEVKTEREFIDSLPIVNVTITPNPSHGQFYINSDSPIQKISIYTNSLIHIKDIYLEESECKRKLVDMSKNKKGVYLLKIQTQSGITTKELILK